MQRCVDIPPHLTYVATLPCETRIIEKINEIHLVPKNQADTFVTKLRLIAILHHIILSIIH